MSINISRLLVSTEEGKRWISNVLFLFLLQGANYILPLLTIPYLVRVLGPDYFGLLAFATATIGYLVLITDYGFNLSATQQVSIHRTESNKLNEIFSSVIIIKLIMMLVCLLLLTLMVFSFDRFSRDWEVYFFTFGMVIGNVLFPSWFYQGVERMGYVTTLNISAKLFFTIFIFVLVTEREHYWLVPLLTSAGFIVSGIIGLYLAKKKFALRLIIPSKGMLVYQLKEGWHVFYSTVAISFYTLTTTFLLGLFTSSSTVGYYSAAEKIIQAVKGIYQPISQAVFPFLSRKIHLNRQKGVEFIKYYFSVISAIMLSLCSGLYLYAAQVIDLILGEQYTDSVSILQIMAFLPFLVAVSNIFGIQTMLTMGYKKAFARILSIAAVIGVGLPIVLIPRFQAVGSAISVLVAELFVTTAMAVFVYCKVFKNVR